MTAPEAAAPARRSTATGPGRVLVLVYGVFAVAATARAGYQIATKLDEAPLAYLLSALAAVVYVVATVALALGAPTVPVMAVLMWLLVVVLVVVLAVRTGAAVHWTPLDTPVIP